MSKQNAKWIIAGEKGTYTNFQSDNSRSIFSFSKGCGDPISDANLKEAASVAGENYRRPKGSFTTCFDDLNKGKKGLNCVIMSTDFEDRLYYDSQCGLNAINDSDRNEIYCPNGYTSQGYIYEYNSSSSNNNYKICKRDSPSDNLDCCYDKDQSTDINTCEDGYTYGTQNCNIRMKLHCDGTDTNIKDSKYCKAWCNNGTGNDLNGCVDGYKKFCEKPENRTGEFCMDICRKAADKDKDSQYNRNKELRAMCENSMISYCEKDIKKSFDANTTESKFCRPFCDDKTRDTDSKGKCDTMMTNYCVTSGADSNYCRCVNPPADIKKYLTTEGVNGIHCIDGTCKSLGYKTRLMENSECPPCIQTATAINNDKSKINVNQQMVCNVDGIPVLTDKPKTPDTPKKPDPPTSGGINGEGTEEKVTSSGEDTSKTSTIPSSSDNKYSIKGFFDMVDENKFNTAMVFIALLAFVFMLLLLSPGNNNNRRVGRNNRGPRYPRDNRYPRYNRDPRDTRDPRDPRDNRDNRDSRDNRDPRDNDMNTLDTKKSI